MKESEILVPKRMPVSIQWNLWMESISLFVELMILLILLHKHCSMLCSSTQIFELQSKSIYTFWFIDAIVLRICQPEYLFSFLFSNFVVRVSIFPHSFLPFNYKLNIIPYCFQSEFGRCKLFVIYSTKVCMQYFFFLWLIIVYILASHFLNIFFSHNYKLQEEHFTIK